MSNQMSATPLIKRTYGNCIALVLTVILTLAGCGSDTDRSTVAGVDAESSVTGVDTTGAAPIIFRVGSVINFFGTPIEGDIRGWAEQVFAEIGVDVELVFIPGRRLMVDLSQGLLDADLVRAEDISKGFENVVQVPWPWLKSCLMAIGLQKNQQAYRSAPQFQPQPQSEPTKVKRIGVISGAPYISRVAYDHWPDANLEEYTSDRQALLMMLNDRIDFVVASHLSLAELQRQAELPLVVYEVLSREQAYLHLHRDHAAHIPALVAALKKHAPMVKHLNCK